MKIALITFECPPDTAYGGIATYSLEAVRMLRDRGHYVEVFSSSASTSRTDDQDGVVVHRIQETDRARFGASVGAVFATRHSVIGFDVLEGPEYHADARGAVSRVPDIPLVLKLHTPSAYLLRLNYYEDSFITRLRLGVGALVRGVTPHWGYHARDEGYRSYVSEIDSIERAHALEADEIVSPSSSLGSELTAAWGLDPTRVVTIPYPFTPSTDLLEIPSGSHSNRVTFIGRLEARKGVLDLMRAIPRILRRQPGTRFRFVGAPEPSPVAGLNMRQYLERRLRSYRESVEFTGTVTHDRLPEILSETAVCVFPSLWENFPFTCLESMAAARGVVGSSAGGMAEMLDAGRSGRLVPPKRPDALAETTLALLNDPHLRAELGSAARRRVLSEYNANRVGALQEASYARAIERRRALGGRHLDMNMKTHTGRP